MRRDRALTGLGVAQVYVLAVMAAVMRTGEQDGEPQGELLFLVPPYDSSKVFFPSYALKAAAKGARRARGPIDGQFDFTRSWALLWQCACRLSGSSLGREHCEHAHAVEFAERAVCARATSALWLHCE